MNKKLTLIPTIALTLIALAGCSNPAPAVTAEPEATKPATVKASTTELVDVRGEDVSLVGVERNSDGEIIAVRFYSNEDAMVTVHGAVNTTTPVDPDEFELDVLAPENEG